jgi:hypothetical protein
LGSTKCAILFYKAGNLSKSAQAAITIRLQKMRHCFCMTPMRIFISQFLAFALLLILSGCFHLKPSEERTRLHLLDQSEIVAWTQAAKHDSTSAALRIQRVELPDYLEDLRIFYRRSDGSPVYVDTDRWAEPLRFGIARYLNAAIAQSDRSELAGNPRLRFNAFEAVRGSGVWVDVQIEQGNANSALRFLHGTGEYPSVAAMVAEMASALDELIERL